MSERRNAIRWVVAACLATLIAGSLLKVNCDYDRGTSYPPPCYSDLVGIYESRGLGKGALPYVDFPSGGTFKDPGFLEYPVGIGAFVLAAAFITHSRESFMLVNMLGLGLAGLVIAAIVGRMVGWRGLRWSVAPALLFYAYLNWDLLAVLCTVAGCFMLERGRREWAGAWFGLGTAVKLYPVLLLVPLVLGRIWERDFRGATRAGLFGGLAIALPNLALFAINPDAWWATYAFHAVRGADIGSVWSLILSMDASSRRVNAASGATLVLGGITVLLIGCWRARAEREFPTLAVGSALIVAFLLGSKVASPQYVLWVLPSLVLLDLRIWWWIALNALAVLVHAVSFGVGVAGYKPEIAPFLVEGTAVIRACVLLGIGAALVNASPVKSMKAHMPDALSG